MKKAPVSKDAPVSPDMKKAVDPGTTESMDDLNGEVTLAEALALRADLQKRIAQLGTRLNDNAKIQEGEKPAEDPTVLLAQLQTYTDTYETLICRINLTNSQTYADGVTLTQLLARRDALNLNISVTRAFLREASQKIDRFSKTEIKIRSAVDVAKLQKTVDVKAKELRQLETAIQRLNWTTVLK